jgi:hypothetical protein
MIPGADSTAGHSRVAHPPHARLLGGVRLQATRRKPGRAIETRFRALALE